MLVKTIILETERSPWEICASGLLTPTAAKKKAAEEEESEPADDGWEAAEEEEEWDPDFDEFDVPKSRSGKSESKEEEELNFEEEEEFNDLFDDEGFDEDAAGDDY